MNEEMLQPNLVQPAESNERVASTLVAAPEINTHRSFSRHVFWTLSARVLMVANSVGTGMILARHFGAAGVGAYAVLTVTVANAVQICGWGVTAANVYFISRNDGRFKSIAMNALLFGLGVGSLLALGIIAVSSNKVGAFHEIPFSLIVVAAVSIPFQMLVFFGLNIFLALEQIKRFNILDTIGQSFGLVNVVLIVAIFGGGLSRIIGLNTAAVAAMAIVISWLVVRSFTHLRRQERWIPDFRLFARAMRYGLKFNISMASMMLVLRSDLLVVNYFRGATEAGVYSVASQGGLLFLVLPTVIGTLLFPRVASSRDETGAFTSVVLRHTAFVLGIFGLATIPGAFLLPLLYGSSFSGSTVQLLLLLPGVYLLGLYFVLVQHFVGTGMSKAVPAFWVITLIFNFAMNLLIVPTYGARGAAIVSTASYSLIFVFVLAWFLAKTGKSLKETLFIDKVELRQLFNVARQELLFAAGKKAR